jgi:hypothetical protein
MEEAPTRNRDAVEVGPDQQRTGKHGPKRSCRARLGSAAQHSIWGFPLIVASSCLGLEEEVLVKRQQHMLLVATPRAAGASTAGAVWAAAAPDTDTSRDTSLSRPTAGEV